MKSLSLQLETEVDPQTGSIKVRLQPSARSKPLDEQRTTFLGILNRANAIAKTKEVHLGLVIDEFQELARFEDEATLWNLRGEIQHHANISYVFTGSRVHMIRLLISSNRAFYKMFNVLNFEPIHRNEIRDWMTRKYEANKVRLTDELDYLLERSGTCTVDRLRLASTSFGMASAAGELTEQMIDRAYEAIIEEDKAYFLSEWQQLTAHQQNVLRALAQDEKKLTGDGARNRYNLPASGSVTNSLKALLERGTVYEIETPPGYAYDNPYFKAWVRMRNIDDIGLPKKLNFTDKLLHCVHNLAESGVAGADELLAQLESTEWERKDYSVKLQSIWSEAFGIYVAMNELGYDVLKIESEKNKRTGKVLSPYRLNKNKSCDLKCKDRSGSCIYIEVKNDNRDMLLLDKAPHGTTLSGSEDLKQWLAKQVADSIEKGANLLFARIPVWKTGNETDPKSDICFELFHSYEPQDELPLPLKEDPPEFFQGIWFLNRDSSVFMKVSKSANRHNNGQTKIKKA